MLTVCCLRRLSRNTSKFLFGSIYQYFTIMFSLRSPARFHTRLSLRARAGAHMYFAHRRPRSSTYALRAEGERVVVVVVGAAAAVDVVGLASVQHVHEQLAWSAETEHRCRTPLLSWPWWNTLMELNATWYGAASAPA